MNLIQRQGPRSRRRLTTLLLAIAWASPGVGTAAGPDEPAAIEFFEKEIRPLLVEKCQKCHGGSKPRGGLSLKGRSLVLQGGDSGPAAVPGKASESLIVEAVEHRGELKMPPKGKLSESEINRLKRWIDLGLPWPNSLGEPAANRGGVTPVRDESRPWWSFQPVTAVSVPHVEDTSWPHSEIDRFILAGLEAQGIAPARPADGARCCVERRST